MEQNKNTYSEQFYKTRFTPFLKDILTNVSKDTAEGKETLYSMFMPTEQKKRMFVERYREKYFIGTNSIFKTTAERDAFVDELFGFVQLAIRQRINIRQLLIPDKEGNFTKMQERNLYYFVRDMGGRVRTHVEGEPLTSDRQKTIEKNLSKNKLKISTPLIFNPQTHTFHGAVTDENGQEMAIEVMENNGMTQYEFTLLDGEKKEKKFVLAEEQLWKFRGMQEDQQTIPAKTAEELHEEHAVESPEFGGITFDRVPEKTVHKKEKPVIQQKKKFTEQSVAETMPEQPTERKESLGIDQMGMVPENVQYSTDMAKRIAALELIRNAQKTHPFVPPHIEKIRYSGEPVIPQTMGNKSTFASRKKPLEKTQTQSNRIPFLPIADGTKVPQPKKKKSLFGKMATASVIGAISTIFSQVFST